MLPLIFLEYYDPKDRGGRPRIPLAACTAPWTHPSAASPGLRLRGRHPKSTRLGLPQPGRAAGVPSGLGPSTDFAQTSRQGSAENGPQCGQSRQAEPRPRSSTQAADRADRAGVAGRGAHLQQQPVDLLRELLDAGVQGLLLRARRHGEHVLVQRAPAGLHACESGRLRQAPGGPVSALSLPSCHWPAHHPLLPLAALPEPGAGGRSPRRGGGGPAVCGGSEALSRRPGPRGYSHPDPVPPDDEGDLPAPGVDEAGPAGVQRDVLPVPGAEAQR